MPAGGRSARRASSARRRPRCPRDDIEGVALQERPVDRAHDLGLLGDDARHAQLAVIVEEQLVLEAERTRVGEEPAVARPVPIGGDLALDTLLAVGVVERDSRVDGGSD